MTPGADRNALLNSIQKGAKLKKTTTNDRSAPIIGKQPTASHGDNGSAPMTARPGGGGDSFSAATAAPSSGGPAMGLGGLFAGGMPKLRSTGSRLISSNDDNRDNAPSSQGGPIPSASKSAESVSGRGTRMNTNLLKKSSEMAGRASSTPFPSSNHGGIVAGANKNRTPPPPPPPPPSSASPPAAPSQSPSRVSPWGGERKMTTSAPLNRTAAANVNVNTSQRGTSPERRATAPAASPPSPMTVAADGERPPLPSRPVGLTSRMQGLRVQESVEQRGGSVACAQPRSSSAAELAPRASKATTIRANWQFPAEGAIPRPGAHSGRVVVYPSGRERGTYINETAAEASDDGDDDHAGNSTSKNERLRAPPKQQPAPMNSSQRPNILLPPLTSNRTLTTTMAGEALGPAKTANKINRRGGGEVPLFNAEEQIQEKLHTLETQLEEAIGQQNFETCLVLKPRINKLKDMLELSQRGLAIDEAKIDAV